MSAAQAARISMDRHTGGDGLRNASAAQMARAPVAAAGGGVAQGALSGARGGGNYAEQASTGAGFPANRTNGGPSGHNGGGAPTPVAAPSGGARPSGTAKAGNVSGHSPRVPPGTDGQPAGRDAGETDRRPTDLGPPRPGQDGGSGT
jgi:hypothetical protein